MKIFLIGYRCTGKTTIGKILAKGLNFDFVDTDHIIEQKTGSNIRQIVEKHGWDRFRLLEKETILNTKNYENIVVATGGGIVIDPDNVQFIKKSGFSIWLDADIKTILKRLDSDSRTSLSRPSLTNHNLATETKEMLNLRNPLYKKSAHVRIDTTIHKPKEIVNIIYRRLKDVGKYPGKSI
ncbi:MAG: shikimate kinase [Thermodesulfobacteriota bacterium]